MTQTPQEHSKIEPTILWLAGMVLTFVVFFVAQVFLTGKAMQFPKYIPAAGRIGVDLELTLSFVDSWAVKGQSPYVDTNVYPPFVTVFFWPFLLMGGRTAYLMVTLLTLGGYLFLSLAFPLLVGRERASVPLIVFFCLSGLFSYGLQFELERGQFNVIAVALSLAGVLIFHCQPRLRLLGYVLFVISVQLKVYPLIFLLLFVDDWSQVSLNIRRWGCLLLANVACLFILGGSVFVEFLGAIRQHMAHPYVWIGNHSIKSFSMLPQVYAAKLGRLSWVNDPRLLGGLQVLLLTLTGVCLLVELCRVWKRRGFGLDSGLIAATTLGALIIPAASHDYKLSVLAGPMALFAGQMEGAGALGLGGVRRALYRAGVILTAVLYCSTLFSYVYKPQVLVNNFPALMGMLMIIVAWPWVQRRWLRAPQRAPSLPTCE